jgi:hypothetical protein
VIPSMLDNVAWSPKLRVLLSIDCKCFTQCCLYDCEVRLSSSNDGLHLRDL